MSNIFTQMLDQASAPEATTEFFFDADEYTQRVLLQGKDEPWDDATAYANHVSQAEALLKPAVVLLSLNRLIETELASNQHLKEAMCARSRTGYAARALLSDEALREHIEELVITVVKTRTTPVVLHMHSPMALLALTTRIAQPAHDLVFDDSAAENVAIYYADSLRAHANTGIAGIIFDGRQADSSPESYKPILNTAEHYLWPIGVRRHEEISFFTPETVISTINQSSFGDVGFVHEKPGALAMIEIAEDAVPEQVLARLETMRSANAT